MEIVTINQVRNELVSNFRKNEIIPIIGSGFTQNCTAKNGKVPSGYDYKEHMITEILNFHKDLEKEVDFLKSENLSEIAEFYYKIVPKENRNKYLNDNFKYVSINENKRNFLTINWPYIYTFNLDDAIEQNSNYKNKLLPNKQINHKIFTNEKCVIKLHGDVSDILSYSSSHEIMTQKQYLDSIRSNASLLDKLEHDYVFQNLIFIGCSLNDELDIKSIVGNSNQESFNNCRYYCATAHPSPLEKIKFESYGITHYIIFDTFEKIYEELYFLWQESRKIPVEQLEKYHIRKIAKLNDNYEKNKPYLLHGKTFTFKDKPSEITVPYFYIQREYSNTIINSFEHTIHLIIGNGTSGKSYLLINLLEKARNKEVYLFESKERLSDVSLNELLEIKNSLLLFDSKVLTPLQFNKIIDKRKSLHKKGCNVVIAVDQNDQELKNVLYLREIREDIKADEIKQIILKNKFSKYENKKINKLLTTTNLGLFSSERTIVDNIIYTSNKLTEKNKYDNIEISTKTVPEIAALIMLAIEKKVYSEDAIKMGLVGEFETHRKYSDPLIFSELAWDTERDASNNSTIKYVVQAEYWLKQKLTDYSKSEHNQNNIIDAFELIVSKILRKTGGLNLEYNTNTEYKKYILFDNINSVFAMGKFNMHLIKKIYSKLNYLLSPDPNYKHQYAKCYIQMSKNAQSTDEKTKCIKEALQNIKQALSLFEMKYKESKKENEKLFISIVHAKYTESVAWCHLCNLQNYTDDKSIENCINSIYFAFNSPYNKLDYVKKSYINYNNIVEKTIKKFVLISDNLSPDQKDKITELYQKIVKENQSYT